MDKFIIEYVRLSSAKNDDEIGIKLSRNLKRKFGALGQKRNDLFKAVQFRPFVRKEIFLSNVFVDELGAMTSAFAGSNTVVGLLCIASNNPLAVFVSDAPMDYGLLKNGNGGTQCMFRYRYTPDGERIDNITDWGLKQFQKAYGKNGSGLISLLEGEMSAGPTEEGQTAPSEFAAIPPSAPIGASPPQGGRSAARSVPITKDDIFHYVYGVLHDPVYRETYAQNLKREFPRIPLYPDFFAWAGWGKRLMDLHIGYETVEPWPLLRLDTPDEKAREAGVAPKAVLKADKDNGIIRLDSETVLSGTPPEVWSYRLGNRSGLEWILDQYKEKTPKDPTIREKFNTYRFADYKEHVIDLIARVTRVSVETVEITEAMKSAKR
jgi:predicted helicase